MKIYDKTFEDMFSPVAKRVIAALTTFFFTFAICSPSALACYTNIKEQTKKEKYEQNILTLSKVNPVGEQLKSIFEIANDLDKELSLVKLDQKKVDQLSVRLKQTADKLKELNEVEKTALATEIERIKDKNLSKLHLSRQKDFNEHYESHMAKVFDALSSVLAKLKLNEQLEKSDISQLMASVDYPIARQNQSTNSELDFVDAPPRDMYTTQSQINALLGVTGSEEWELDDYLATDSATQSSDLIEQKVAELGADPVQLYNWVYNNVKFIPSYGVMQGADYTMQTKQGNAFDISSTLVSMFRTADIPARFNYGVVALDAKKVQNWVGGVKNIGAATNLISQGGIPHRQITFGGNTEEIEIEHVWVEAYIDGEWHSFDPSFKQYEYEEGIDIENEVPLETDLLNQKVEDTVEFNAEGWVKYNDLAELQATFDQYYSEINSYLDDNHSGATMGELLGVVNIIENSFSELDQIYMPFNRQTVNAIIPNIPESFFYKFRIQIGSTTGGTFGMPIEWGSSLADVELTTVSLLGKDLAMHYKPATPEDAEIINSYIPENAQSAEELPSYLPANAVNLIGEIVVDGSAVASTSQVTLGDTMMTRLGFVKPQSQWKYSQNTAVAGEYHAIGVDMHGLSRSQFSKLKSRAEATQEKIDAQDYETMSTHDVTGLVLQTGIQSYFAETYAMSEMISKANNIVYYRQPSYGMFSTNFVVQYNFGQPHKIYINGVMMDVDRLQNNTESRDNCYDKWLSINKSIGMQSSVYEHVIPERIFSSETEQVDGVSTIKALTLARMDGQKIYTLTKENAEQLNNIEIDDLGRADISQALQLGYAVTVHEKPVLVNGWKGSGYSIIDQDYGVGAYKISGGANGGFLSTNEAIAIGLVGLALGFATGLAAFFAVLIAVILLADLILDYMAIDHHCDGLGGLIIGSVIITIAGLALAGPVGAIIGFIIIFVMTELAISIAQSPLCKNS